MANHKGDVSYQAYRILQVAFVIAPILAGLDKFFHFMVNWNDYLHPMAHSMLSGKQQIFWGVVGVIEIVAGLGVLFKPRIFAYIVFVWLILIVINLVMARWFDIALRDIGLALGALALGRLAARYDVKEERRRV